MSAEAPPKSKPEKTKKATNRRSQLKVVFDTNALYVTQTSIGSASDLVRHEIANLISDAKYPDLDIIWHIPEVVRHERQYQMQTEALKLRGPINRIERLLSHNLALTDQALLDHVKTKIDEAKHRLGLQELALDQASVDWAAVIHAAEYRIPPFEGGDKEKGFRDALIAETFLQLVASSPKTPAICRVVLVTSDLLLSQAVNDRLASYANASVLASIEELKGLINTIVSNVGEEFISQLLPKATRLFFVSADDENTLYYKEKVSEKLTSKFASVLEERPEGATFRRNATWYIGRPNFSRKEGRRVSWISRVEIEAEAGSTTKEEDKTGSTSFVTVGPNAQYFLPNANPLSNVATVGPANLSTDSGSYFYGHNYYNTLASLAGPAEKRVVTHKGKDVFEVLWSTEVTMAKELKKPNIEDIRHVAITWQPTQ